MFGITYDTMIIRLVKIVDMAKRRHPGGVSKSCSHIWLALTIFVGGKGGRVLILRLGARLIFALR